MPGVHRFMYRDSLDGLTEQIRSLEAQKVQLEVDLAGMKRVRWPQRALRACVALLILAGAGAAGGVLGYRHAVVQLREASEQDARTALSRIERCNERLKEVFGLCREDYLSRVAVQDSTPF